MEIAIYAICHQDDFPILHTVNRLCYFPCQVLIYGWISIFLVWSSSEKGPESFIVISVVCCTWLMVHNENCPVTACGQVRGMSRSIKCLSDTYLETAAWRRLHMAASRYIEQPPHSRLQTAAWRVKKHLFQNSCLTALSRDGISDNRYIGYL